MKKPECLWRSAPKRRASARKGEAVEGRSGPSKQPIQALLGPHKLHLSSLEKLLWPQEGITKAELIQYFLLVAPSLLEWVSGLPLYSTRAPEGMAGESFFARRPPPGLPPWVPRVSLPWGEATGVCHPAHLAAMANLACVELHLGLLDPRGPNLARWVFFDLDPGEGADAERVREAAIQLGELLSTLGLPALPKTSGLRGIHLLVPVEGWSVEEARELARAVASALELWDPRRFASSRARKEGRILLDWALNAPSGSLVAPYSPRLAPGAPVSTPVTWEELATGWPSFRLRYFLDDPTLLASRPGPAPAARLGLADVLSRLGIERKARAGRHGGSSAAPGRRLPAESEAGGPPAPPQTSTQTGDLNPWGLPLPIKPMLATAGDAPPSGEDWIYEVKWDGVRAVIYLDREAVRIFSRDGREMTSLFPELQDLKGNLGCERAVLDGEVISIDASGRPSFERVARRLGVEPEEAARRSARWPVLFVCFDLLALEGSPLLSRPFEERRALLEEVLREGGRLVVSRPLGGEGGEALLATRKAGLEGIVAKRKGSPYLPGTRSRDWVKVKPAVAMKVAVVGYTPGKGSRADLGALVVAAPEEGAYRYLGRVGSGLTQKDVEALLGKLAEIPEGPPPAGAPRLKGVRWLEPRVRLTVAARGLTSSGILLHARAIAWESASEPLEPPSEAPGENPRSSAPKRGSGRG